MPYTANPVWSLPVNWDQGVLERLEWKTDVMSSELGFEQRVPRRLYPRRTFEANFTLHEEDRQYFNILASVAAGKEFVTPIWHDGSPSLAQASAGASAVSVDTRFREFAVGELVFLRGRNARTYEIATVHSIAPTSLQLISPLEKTWPKGTMVYPAKLGRFDSDIKPTKLTDKLMSLQAAIRLTTPSKFASTWVPAYKFLPVISKRPNDATEQEFEYARSMSMLDNGLGTADYYDILGGPILRQTHSWTLVGISAHYEMRKLLYNLRGRAKALWLPTYMSDMTLAVPVSSGNTYIEIVNIGVSRNEVILEGRKDIRIELRDKSVFYREITSYVEMSEDTERLGLDAPIGRDIAVDEVLSISYCMIARLDQDSVELNHVTDSTGLTTCRLNFFGPTQGTPLGIPIYTSKPYPVDILDAMDMSTALRSAIAWEMDKEALDITLSVVSVSMPVVVAYELITPDPEAMDVTIDLVSVSMPVVVTYETITPDPEAMDVTVGFVSVVVVNVPIITYTIDVEAVDMSVSLVGVTLS